MSTPSRKHVLNQEDIAVEHSAVGLTMAPPQHGSGKMAAAQQCIAAKQRCHLADANSQGALPKQAVH